jgi:hypothetical protein
LPPIARFATISHNREIAMSSPKSVPFTVHLKPFIAETVKARAAEARRPISQFLNIVIEDAVVDDRDPDAQSGLRA